MESQERELSEEPEERIFRTTNWRVTRLSIWRW